MNAPTALTVFASPVKPVAEAVTVVVPMAIPFICGGVLGAVCPPAMNTEGETVRVAVLLLMSVIVTPLVGAGAASVTFSGAD